MSKDDGDGGNYIAHFAKEELEDRIDSGEIDLEPDAPILPQPHQEILGYLRRGHDNPEELDAFRRLRSDGVERTLRGALSGDDLGTLAFFQGWKEARAGEDKLIPLLWQLLGKEAMTIYVADETDAGKTHFLLLLVVIALDLADYDAAVTNVPLQTVEGDEATEHSDVKTGGLADVVIPARWDRTGKEPTLEWAADPELVKVFLEWHEAAGLPLEHVVATTEAHVRVVTEYVEGRVFIAPDEYGTSGGGAKGTDPNQDRPTVKFVQGIRKHPWYASIAIGGHAATDIPPDMRQQVKLGAEKPDPRTVELYETATGDGFEDQVGVPFDVPGHRLDDYHDKIQPVWAFIGNDDEDDEGSQDGLSDAAQEELAVELYTSTDMSYRAVSEHDAIDFGKDKVRRLVDERT